MRRASSPQVLIGCRRRHHHHHLVGGLEHFLFSLNSWDDDPI
jgi:hypothetical protein